MAVLKLAQMRERKPYMWGVGFASIPHIPLFPVGGCIFQLTLIFIPLSLSQKLGLPLPYQIAGFEEYSDLDFDPPYERFQQYC